MLFHYYKINEVKQHGYLQIVQLTFDTPTYTHNPYLFKNQSNY